MIEPGLPAWVILHIPHDSTVIPPEVRGQFVLDDNALSRELLCMTDHFTLELFGHGVPEPQIVRAPVSRLVVDIERFEDDSEEPMAERGMGVIYQKTHDLSALRRPLSHHERQTLIEQWYRPHHQSLTDRVEQTLLAHGRALLIDCHSFPARALPYGPDPCARRPSICIGTDSFHTPGTLVEALTSRFQEAGFDIALNTPFAGALVPMPYYRRDPRVMSVMVEVRRDLYMDEQTGDHASLFNMTASKIRQAITKSCATS